jgi:hypothetical protein
MGWKSLEDKAAANDVQTIGGRKGNARNVGQYFDTPPPQANSVAIYLPSAKLFLRGNLGHVFTGILVLTDGFAYKAIGLRNPEAPPVRPRDREMIFLVPNDPPTPEHERASAITEPYVNRPFTPAETGDDFGLHSARGKNNRPIVHGGEGNTSHEQLRQLIVNSNRYLGVIRDVEDPVEGQGKMIGFTVMKEGFRPGTRERLENVYGWTSNSMNRKVWSDPTPDYRKRRLEGVPPERLGMVSARLKAQVADVWADKIQAALDRLLALQLEHGAKPMADPRSPATDLIDPLTRLPKVDTHFVNILQYLEM